MKTICTYAAFLILLTGCIPSGKKTELAFDSKVTGDPGGSGLVVYNREKSLEAFGQTVYPYVRTKCLDCHNSATGGQSPVFADVNMEKAFDAITMTKKVDLVHPELSRVVIKVAGGHPTGYGASSEILLDAIKEWARLAPPSSNEGVVVTESKSLPTETSFSQTEYGTLLLQAEQSDWASEIISGRFSEEQDSAAGEGKYLLFSPADPSPRMARRDFVIDANRFASCREFDDAADIQNPANRVIKIMQDRVHNPSGNILSGSNVVNDGFNPRIASLQFNLIRPDKRLEYANMLMTRNFTSLSSVIITDGYPQAIPRTVGNKLAALSGNPILLKPSIFVLPKFAAHGAVFDASGNFVPGSSLYPVFENSFNESPSSIKDSLSSAEHAPLKKFAFYKALKDFMTSIFYNVSTPRTSPTINFGTFVNSGVEPMMARDVNISFQCPVGVATCTSAELKYLVVDSGPVLTQGNALDCYTVSGGQFQFVSSASLCQNSNPAYFHLIDLYMHVGVNDPVVAVRSVNTNYTSNSATSHLDVETYSATSTSKIFLNDLARKEEQPDYLFASPNSVLGLSDLIQNFSTTTHTVLRASNCVSCHGSNTPPAGAPQFASTSQGNSYQVIKQYINFNDPTKSFRFTRTGMLAHNCTAANANDCASITSAIVNSITQWRNANESDVQASGGQKFISLTRDQRLPARVKYKFSVTEAGSYNVWAKIKNVTVGATTSTRINFRLRQGSTAVKYSVGSGGSLVNEPCYPWTIGTTADAWEWTSPGRQNELALIDQRGYILLNNDFSPKVLPDNRIYFNLQPGEYTLDMIGLTESMRLDSVGINKVVNPSNANSRLEFQPDRRAVDSKNVSDYKRKILHYDLSGLLSLSQGQSAFFEIEAKKDFDGQNYVFRNPRFSTSPSNLKIHVKGIKVLINGRWSVPDSTYNSFEAIVGDNKVITYAPLVALTTGSNDLISFQFDKLELSQQSLSILYPKGAPPAVVADRRCNHLDFFVKNVKPILQNVKVMLNSEMDSYLAKFPGSPTQNEREPQAYNCISCHGPNHPYFKMSTFVNDEEFCREAISRVDFDSFYQSLVIRGINGTGNHPKFVFVEKFYKNPSDQNNFKVHNLGSDYNLNLHVASGGIASEIIPGPMLKWTNQEIMNHPSYAALTPTQKTAATSKAGRLKRLKPRTIDLLQVVNYSWFIPEVHNPLIYDQNSQPDNNLSSFDVIIPTGGSIDAQRRGPVVYDVMGFEDAGLPSTSVLGDRNGRIPLAGPTKLYVANGQPGFDRANMDYDSTTAVKDPSSTKDSNWEFLRDYYREVVIEWIRRENDARNMTSP